MTNQVITIGGRYPDQKEIVDDLEMRLSLKDKKHIASYADKPSLGIMHHGFGTWIRNSYGLWTVSPLTEQWRTNPASRQMVNEGGVDIDHSPDHPDNLSMRIIEDLWDRLSYLRP